MDEDHWWKIPSLRDGLQVALDSINEARAAPRHRSGWELTACFGYFGALNKLANCLDSTTSPPDPPPGHSDAPARRSEPNKYKNLLFKMTPADQRGLLDHPAVGAFARFEPLVLDHSSSGMSQRIADLTEPVVQGASRQHRHFRRDWLGWEERRSGQTQTLVNLIRAVLVVRNNLNHGEKTPSGPDMQRRERNQAVGRIVLPILETIVDVVLGRPSHRLAAYGTLRPGQPNQDKVGVAGEWAEITLTGQLWTQHSLPAFMVKVPSEKIPAALFTSAELPTIWPRLDDFEGRNYERRLGLYECEGIVGVANVYEWAEEHY
ncbi:gamma-glutamylcyclotransferase family protein [Micromonospora matsumotoense]|uniref:gamma-glutamylcyclotransferase family protein n=1 Tax=Micromonospora matsumotoense TaxID=121616 RepID=UPI0033C87F2F